MIKGIIQKKYDSALADVLDEIRKERNDDPILPLYARIKEIELERPKNNLADYSISELFHFARDYKIDPNILAKRVADKILNDKPDEISEVVANGGYINFFLSHSYLQKQLKEISESKESYGTSNFGQGKAVIIEYSQPNIAKKMHVGHLRTTILGDALANIYEMSGYKIIRWNYLGDWGTQFGKLITAYKLWGNEAAVKSAPIETLHELYVKFHAEAKKDPDLDVRAQAEFKKLEEGDEENHRLWQWFKAESLKSFDHVYARLGIKFDVDIGESFYEKQLKGLVADLVAKGIAQESEGGVVIKLDAYGLPPALIRKSDGASLYLTRDIANLRYRLDEYRPNKILYVVGNEQSLHFEQLFAIAKILGLTRAKLNHVKYGLVLGENKKKLATREGRTIFLEDVLNRAVALARQIVENKNPAIAEDEKEKIAGTVGVGALKYELLKEHRNSDVVFDWQRMLDFSGNSAPYLQYTYTRLTSITAKAATLGTIKADFSKIAESSELALIKQIIEFPDVLGQCQAADLTNPLALYLFDLANRANNFYEKVRVLNDEDQTRLGARLTMIKTVAAVLSRGLAILGIGTLKQI